MPNQAGSSPAKSRRSSSSQIGDMSCRDRTGERWVSRAQGFEEAQAECGVVLAAQARSLSLPGAPRGLLLSLPS